MKKLIALTATTALLAGPAAPVLSGAASADPGEREKRGTCAGATYEFSVDRDRGGYELSGDLDRAAPGSSWTLTLVHDGRRIHKATRTADRDGDVEIEGYAADRAGSDTFVLKVRAAGAKACTSTISMG